MSTTEETTQQGTSQEDGQEEGQQTFTVNGEELTLEELQAGYLRQSDYTRKTQELADERKKIVQSGQSEQTEDEKAAAEWLQRYLDEKGVVTKGELERLSKNARMEEDFKDLLSENPGLKQFEKPIRALQEVSGKSFEEVAIENGFMTSEDKLDRAKSSRRKMVSDNLPRANKSIMDMTEQEYADFKKQNGYTGSTGSTLRGAK